MSDEKELRAANRLARVQAGVGVAQVVATVAVVVLGAVLVHRYATLERQSAAKENGHEVAEAYAVQLGEVARGVRDMLACHEKLKPFATGPGSRVAFPDLEALGAVLKVPQLRAVEQASNELNNLFYPGYSAPLPNTRAAYTAWQREEYLQRRAERANELLSAALPDLGGQEPPIDDCKQARRLESQSGLLQKPLAEKRLR
jgi:hypothetical protein